MYWKSWIRLSITLHTPLRFVLDLTYSIIKTIKIVIIIHHHFSDTPIIYVKICDFLNHFVSLSVLKILLSDQIHSWQILAYWSYIWQSICFLKYPVWVSLTPAKLMFQKMLLVELVFNSYQNLPTARKNTWSPKAVSNLPSARKETRA